MNEHKIGDRVRIARGALKGFHATIVPRLEDDAPGWIRVELVTRFFSPSTRLLQADWLEPETAPGGGT